MRVRSMVGIIPLFAVETLDATQLCALPLFQARLRWVLENRPELAKHIALMHRRPGQASTGCSPSRHRGAPQRVLRYLLDEHEFLSPHGVRSLSRFHQDHPYTLRLGGEAPACDYVPGESDSGLFGGNSNWRGPVWIPLNYLLIEALKRYHHFYGDYASRWSAPPARASPSPCSRSPRSSSAGWRGSSSRTPRAAAP